MNGLYPGPATEPGWNLASGNPSGPGVGDAGRAEVRRAGEVHHRGPERVLQRRRRAEGHRLHRGRVADRDVGELGRVVHAQVVRQPGVGGVQQDVPDLLRVRRARIRRPWVQRQAHRLIAQVDLDGALLGQVIPRQQAAELPQPSGRARPLRPGDRGGRRGRPRVPGNGQRYRGSNRRRKHGYRPAFYSGHRSEGMAIHNVILFSLMVCACPGLAELPPAWRGRPMRG